jgi:hypothetical protein
MQIDTDTQPERITYDYRYGDTLSQGEEEMYWSATRDVEEALAQVTKFQEARKSDDGKIRAEIFSGNFQELDNAIKQLDEATTILRLIKKAADSTRK